MRKVTSTLASSLAYQGGAFQRKWLLTGDWKAERGVSIKQGMRWMEEEPQEGTACAKVAKLEGVIPVPEGNRPAWQEC